MRSLFEINSLTKEEILKIMDYAKLFKKNNNYFEPNNLFACNVFLEPSTRTRFSFEVAQRKLGFDVLNFEENVSSMKKGETLYDTIKTFESIGVNLFVIRHFEREYFKQLNNINVPIINGGDGSGNHPTQSLLDFFTIKDEFNSISSLKIGIFGDLLHSRVARSNVQSLHKFGNELFFSCPLDFYDKEYDKYGKYYENIDDIISELDVVMLLRVQKERHSFENSHGVNYLEKYGLNKKRYEMLKSKAIIMHPSPFNRNIEIEDSVVESSKSRIFSQMNNGVYVRMAIIRFLMEVNSLRWEKY